MSKKYEKICTTLNYIEYFLILASAITKCISLSTFASLIGIPMGLEKEKEPWWISILHSIEVSISKALNNSNISHDEFVLIDNVLREYDKMNKWNVLK